MLRTDPFKDQLLYDLAAYLGDARIRLDYWKFFEERVCRFAGVMSGAKSFGS
jgi:hypothetical protein